MDLTLFDVILLVGLGGFVMFGVWFGMMHTLGSLFGTLAGTLISSHILVWFGPFLRGVFGESQWVDLGLFFLVFMIVSKLIGFGFYLLDSTFSILTHLPFLKSIDRLVGAAIGFVEGVITIGILLYIGSRYNLGENITEAMNTSTIAPWFVNVSSILQPLVPAALREIRSIFGI